MFEAHNSIIYHTFKFSSYIDEDCLSQASREFEKEVPPSSIKPTHEAVSGLSNPTDIRSARVR